MSAPLVEVAGLQVEFPLADGVVRAVRGVSFAIAEGECLAIVGESGSGKSVSARSLLGLAGETARVRAETLAFGGRDLTRLRPAGWRELRGGEIGLVLQDALSSLDPLRRIGREVSQPLLAHGLAGRREAPARAVDLLREVDLPDPERRARHYPHQLSGGQRQRALIAAAIACGPRLLIADEPTTALDVTVQAQILALLARRKARGTALLLVSHDLAVVSRLADRVAVMRAGEIVETGPTGEVLRRPREPYTRALIDAVPGRRARVSAPAAPTGPALLVARDLVKRYPSGRGTFVAVDGVSLSLRPGETLGVVGESGSGKTTVARMVLGFLDPDGGSVALAGAPWSGVAERDRRERRRTIQAIHQDPLSSFDPRFTVERIVREALGGAADGRGRVAALLERVGLEPELLGRRPLELSGGQRQRVAIARALAPEPRVLVCDEPVSSLDVTVQAQVLELLADLRDRLGLAMLFISHDLGVIRQVSDRVMVMQDGRVVEEGDAETVFTRPRDGYTRALLEALPRLEPSPAVAELIH